MAQMSVPACAFAFTARKLPSSSPGDTRVVGAALLARSNPPAPRPVRVHAGPARAGPGVLPVPGPRGHARPSRAVPAPTRQAMTRDVRLDF
ncbi:hypothetical protein GCM10027079_06860 [Sediminivirga luteola]|uniref:Uncharacterized protein n=1 Tax=Sediminivirga luteola TaxID=1774748 RepID=A0A8J2XLY5_9MICO|nr:hypothetical protein GCM10011333_32380 [Sediminivirga luteola]